MTYTLTYIYANAGTIRAAATHDPIYHQWLADNGLNETLMGTKNMPNRGTESSVIIGIPSHIDYSPLVTRMVRILELLLEKQGGIVISGKPEEYNERGMFSSNTNPNLSWILREFEFVDMLINQLELMLPGDRRRCLMALQYALATADIQQVCRFRCV